VVAEHSEKFRVAWVDTDAGRRIHFTAAFRWAEATETSLYRKLGVLVFEDEVEVRLRVERVGTTSMTFGWHVLHDGEVAIEGRHTVVHVGADGRPEPLDDRTRQLLAGG
jgi:acyl-CoA thioester hydrolase